MWSIEIVYLNNKLIATKFVFVKFEVQLNIEIYSSFATIYINPVITII